MRNVILFFMLCGAMFFGGCYAVYNANRAEDLSREGSIVFTRPARFTPFFGSYSISDFVEIVYEKAYKTYSSFGGSGRSCCRIRSLQ